jgi:PAB1-binding protein PBP1
MMTSLSTRFSGGASNNGKPTTSPANAWARPLQSKTGPPPGMGHPDKASASAASAKSASNPNGASLAMINRERLLHLSLTLVGQKVVVTQTNGSVLEGIFHTFTPFPGLSAEMKNRYVFNTVKLVKPPTSGEDPIKDGTTVIIPADKVVYVHAKNVDLDRPSANGGSSLAQSDVMTDTQISGSHGGRDGDLVSAGTAWTTSGGSSRVEALAPSSDKGGSLRAKGLQGSIGEWDQFKANEELFNVNASYDENLYTTELDKSQLDSRKIAAAERLAREIEKTTSANIHIAEERGHVVETDLDEEDRYSGVLTKDGKQRHSVVSKDAQKKKAVSEAKNETAKSNGAAAAPKMNYAAAAAKADAGKKGTTPGLSGQTAAAATPPSPDTKPADTVAKVTPDSKKDDKSEPSKSQEKPKSDEKGPEKSSEPEVKDGAKKTDSSESALPAEKPETTEKPKDSGPEKGSGKESNESTETKAETDNKSEAKGVTKTSKLNANAKSFSFNPNAKTFTPTFGGASTPETQPHQQPQQVAEMHAPMQMHAGGHPMQQPHYMHAPMGQPGKFLEDSFSGSYIRTHVFCFVSRNDAYDESAVPRNEVPSPVWWNGSECGPYTAATGAAASPVSSSSPTPNCGTPVIIRRERGGHRTASRRGRLAAPSTPATTTRCSSTNASPIWATPRRIFCWSEHGNASSWSRLLPSICWGSTTDAGWTRCRFLSTRLSHATRYHATQYAYARPRCSSVLSRPERSYALSSRRLRWPWNGG